MQDKPDYKEITIHPANDNLSNDHKKILNQFFIKLETSPERIEHVVYQPLNNEIQYQSLGSLNQKNLKIRRKSKSKNKRNANRYDNAYLFTDNSNQRYLIKFTLPIIIDRQKNNATNFRVISGEILGRGGFGKVILSSVKYTKLKDNYCRIDEEIVFKKFNKITESIQVQDEINSLIRESAVANAYLKELGKTTYKIFYNADGETIKRFGIFMPKIPGKSLANQEILNHISKMSVYDRLKLMIQITEELNKFHQAGYVHHDVKLDNIIFDEQINKLKLCDFGLARNVNHCLKDFPGTIIYADVYAYCSDWKSLPSIDLYALALIFAIILAADGNKDKNVLYELFTAEWSSMPNFKKQINKIKKKGHYNFDYLNTLNINHISSLILIIKNLSGPIATRLSASQLIRQLRKLLKLESLATPAEPNKSQNIVERGIQYNNSLRKFWTEEILNQQIPFFHGDHVLMTLQKENKYIKTIDKILKDDLNLNRLENIYQNTLKWLAQPRIKYNTPSDMFLKMQYLVRQTEGMLFSLEVIGQPRGINNHRDFIKNFLRNLKEKLNLIAHGERERYMGLVKINHLLNTSDLENPQLDLITLFLKCRDICTQRREEYSALKSAAWRLTSFFMTKPAGRFPALSSLYKAFENTSLIKQDNENLFMSNADKNGFKILDNAIENLEKYFMANPQVTSPSYI